MIQTFTFSPTQQPTINVYLNEKKAVSESKFKKMHPEEVKKLITGRCHQADTPETLRFTSSPLMAPASSNLVTFHRSISNLEKRNIDGGNDTPLPTGQDQDRHRDEGQPRPLSGLVTNTFFSFCRWLFMIADWVFEQNKATQNYRIVGI